LELIILGWILFFLTLVTIAMNIKSNK